MGPRGAQLRGADPCWTRPSHPRCCFLHARAAVMVPGLVVVCTRQQQLNLCGEPAGPSVQNRTRAGNAGLSFSRPTAQLGSEMSGRGAAARECLSRCTQMSWGFHVAVPFLPACPTAPSGLCLLLHVQTGEPQSRWLVSRDGSCCLSDCTGPALPLTPSFGPSSLHNYDLW